MFLFYLSFFRCGNRESGKLAGLITYYLIWQLLLHSVLLTNRLAGFDANDWSDRMRILWQPGTGNLLYESTGLFY